MAAQTWAEIEEWEMDTPAARWVRFSAQIYASPENRDERIAEIPPSTGEPTATVHCATPTWIGLSATGLTREDAIARARKLFEETAAEVKFKGAHK